MMHHVVPQAVLERTVPTVLSHVPAGFEPFVIADMARTGRPIAYVMADGQRMGDVEQVLSFLVPEIPVLSLPGWDCLPYDRVSPGSDISARRLHTLNGLIAHARNPHPAIVLASVNAIMQRVPPRSVLAGLGFMARPGHQLDMSDLTARLERNGFERVSTVREVGEYAVRGGILDVFPAGDDEPTRLDFFGDTLESIRSFDPVSQRTTGQIRQMALQPMSEVTLDADTISRFRSSYLAMFGAANRDDALYQAISEGRRYPGMEHWLPLFHERLETSLDYLSGFDLVCDHLTADAAGERFRQITDYFEARQSSLVEAERHAGKAAGGQGTPYKPVSPTSLYIEAAEMTAALEARNVLTLTPFAPLESGARRVVRSPARAGPRWAGNAVPIAKAASTDHTDGEPDEPATNALKATHSDGARVRVNVFDQVVAHIAERRLEPVPILIAAWSQGSLERLLQVLAEHGLERVRSIRDADELNRLEEVRWRPACWRSRMVLRRRT